MFVQSGFVVWLFVRSLTYTDMCTQVYGGVRRRSKHIDDGMYILDTQELHWTHIPSSTLDNGNPEALFLQVCAHCGLVEKMRARWSHW